MYRRILALLVLLLCCCTVAAAEMTLPADLTEIGPEAFAGDPFLTGIVTLPVGVASVGDGAFAETGLYALHVPAGCEQLGNHVLRGTSAAYLYLEGSATQLDAATLGELPYVFAPGESPAAALGERFVDTAKLLVHEGFYYRVMDEGIVPLCPVNRTTLPETVALPDAVADQPLLCLDSLVMPGCEDTLLTVPCLPIPEGLNAKYRCTLSALAPEADAELAVGVPVTFTVTTTGAGALTYKWSLQHGETILQEETAVPAFTFTPLYEEDISLSVTVTDSAGHAVISMAEFYYPKVETPVTYRALLVGNTYAGESNTLYGCDTDVRAIGNVLDSMHGSGYTVNRQYDLTANGILNAIASTFAEADENDVSLFHFSGHGTSNGAIVGTNGTTLYPATLRAELDRIPGTKVILLDCCYSGAFISRSASASPSAFNSAIISVFAQQTRGDDDLAANGYQVLTACSSTEQSKSLTGDGVHYWGAFTYSLCYGSGYDEWNDAMLASLPADTNGDRAITLGECRSGVAERIAYLNTMIVLEQSVQAYGDNSFVLWYK